VVKEDTSWIKVKANNGNGYIRSASEIYNFFVLLTIDQNVMHDIVRTMMAQAVRTSNSTSSQAASINRLRQNFFQGF
jgi:hypothetical protein